MKNFVTILALLFSVLTLAHAGEVFDDVEIENTLTMDSLTASSVCTLDSSKILSSVSSLPINLGGTGQTTANAALNALLPSQTGNSGKVLSTNGSNTSWSSVGTGTVTNVSSGDSSINVSNPTTTPDIRVAWPMTAGAAGTASAPAITWGGSGIFQSSYGLLNFATSGFERLRLENNGDVIIAPGGSGTLTVNGPITATGNLAAVDGNFSGNISAANYPPPPPTGSNNTFAGFDNSGALESVPGFNIDTTSGGQNVALTQHPNDGGGSTVHSFSTAFEPLQDSPNENWNVFNYYVNMDAASSGFTQGTNGNAVQLLNGGFNHQGTGNTGALIIGNFSNTLGNGTDPITIKGLGGIALSSNVQSGVTIDGQMYGATFNPTLQSGAAVGSNENIQAFWDGAQFNVPENNHSSFVSSPTITELNTNANYNAFQSNPNITTLTGNAGAFGASFSPTIGTTSTNGTVVSFYSNPNITTMGSSSNVHGLDLYGVIATSHNEVRSMNVAPTINGGDAQYQGLTIGPNGSATLPFVRGIEVNLTQLASSTQKTGMTITDGKLETQSNYATDTLPASPGFLSLNQIGDQFWIKPGNPVSSTAVFANNSQGTFVAEDDMGPDGFGGFIGFAQHPNIVNGGVAVGKTVDTYTGDLQAFSVANLSGLSITDGGTLTNAQMYVAGGLAPSGGSLVNTNLWGFKTSPFFGISSTNAWGFYDDSGSENYMDRLSLGTASKKNTASHLLDVGGEVYFDMIKDATDNETLDPSSRHAIKNGNNVIDWDAQKLTDDGGTDSLKWKDRLGYNGSGTEILDYSGDNPKVPQGIQLNTSSSKPTCDSGHRGLMWNEEGGTGVADILYVCQKDAADAYVWVTH